MIAAAKPEEDIDELQKVGLRKMLSESAVLKIVPVSPVTLWRMVKRGEFPPPTFITANKKSGTSTRSSAGRPRSRDAVAGVVIVRSGGQNRQKREIGPIRARWFSGRVSSSPGKL
jgi:hypothetical protein